MPQPWVDENFAWFFPIFFAGLWVTIGLMVSRSGWAQLAQQYPAPNRPPGKSLRVLRARVGQLSSYNNVVSAIPTADGLHLYVCFLFRIGHAPMLIPWSSITVIGRTKTWFWEYWALQIKDPAAEMDLRFSASAERALLTHAPAPARS